MPPQKLKIMLPDPIEPVYQNQYGERRRLSQARTMNQRLDAEGVPIYAPLGGGGKTIGGEADVIPHPYH
jgi:hypothetical protein